MANPSGRALVVGLGNPGDEYARTRHNLGFLIADELARRARATWRRKFGGQLADAAVAGRSAWIVKPETYMNLSGQCVGQVARFFGVAPADVVVIHDDVDLEFGRLKLKHGGGDGGHKGVRSVAQALGTPEFPRVRFGVGKQAGRDTADHVLSPMSRAEEREAEIAIQEAADAVELILRDGMTAAMNRFNRRPPMVEDGG